MSNITVNYEVNNGTPKNFGNIVKNTEIYIPPTTTVIYEKTYGDLYTDNSNENN